MEKRQNILRINDKSCDYSKKLKLYSKNEDSEEYTEIDVLTILYQQTFGHNRP